MTITVERLAETVTPYVQGAPEDTIKGLVLEGAIQFARDTRIWQHYVGSTELDATEADTIEIEVPTPVDADLPDAERDLNIPDESDIIGLSRFRFTATDSDDPYDTQEGEDARQSNFLIAGTDYNVESNLFTIQRDTNYSDNRRILSSGGVLEIWATLEPTSDALTITTTLEKYSTGIKDWALYELMRMPKNPWFNRMVSQESKASYDLKVAEAVKRRAKGRTNRPLRIQHHQFV